MADPATRSRTPRGFAIFGAATLVLIFLIALGVTLAIASRGRTAPPTELAARVPASVELYVAVDTDLASDRWMHLQQQLDHLGVLERTIEERDNAFAEEDIDFDAEVLPVLTEIKHAAFVVELPDGSAAEPQFASLIETRDVAGLRDLIDRLQLLDEPRSEREDSVDEELGLDVSEYFTPRDFGGPELVIASRGGMVYLGTDADYLRSLVRRADSEQTLDEVPEFKRLADEADGDALLFAFLDTHDLLQALADELANQLFGLGPLYGVDGGALDQLDSLSEESPRYLASTISANDKGFDWELLAISEPDPDLPDAFFAKADIESASAATPAEARLFFAAAELGAQVQEQLTLLREEGGDTADLLDEGLAQFQDQTNVDLEGDLLPRLTGTFAFSLGIRALALEEPDFALLLTDTDDQEALAGELERLRRVIERECGCDTELALGEHGGFSFVGWPNRRIERRLEDAGSLAESERFQDTLAMLPNDPQGLIYVDLGFVFDDLVESGDIPVDEFQPDAIRGLGMSWSRDGDLSRVSVAIPIEAP